MFTTHFYGQEISNYGKENGRVDYRAFAGAFDAVLNNEIMRATWGVCGEWLQESGFIDNSDEIDEIDEHIDELNTKISDLYGIEPEDENEDEYISGEIEGLEEQIRVLEDEKDELECEQDEQLEVFQWYIISDQGANICREYNEILYYNETLDMYLWGVTHYGTAWDYVLTNIPCEKIEK